MIPRVTLTSSEILNSQYMRNVIGMSGIMISAQVKKTRNA